MFLAVTPRSPRSPFIGRSCWPDTRPQRKRLGSCLQCIFLTWCSRILQLTFTLWELAKHRKCQEKLRAEINETLEKVKARGDADFTANDLESMPYLVAVTKVCWSYLFVCPNEG